MALSVYIHFPWCLQKCPYCDFATASIRRENIPQAAYTEAVLRELELRAGDLAGERLVSVFFGGGTPSLWDTECLGQVLRALRGQWNVAEDLEVTVECNPSSLDQRKAAELCAQGVNRLSVGVQSLDDQRLRFLGRLHDANRALEVLRQVLPEVPRVSADFMFGMPDQRAEAFVEQVERVVALGVEHVSAYALTIEPATQFGELHRKGRLPMATDDAYADTFLAVREAMLRLGFEHYEVSNYAHPGHASLHNQHYWRGGAYLGLGAGAVGCLPQAQGGARRYRNAPRGEHYIDAIATTLAPRDTGATPSPAVACEVFEETLDGSVLLQEALMLGLRTSEGVHLPSVERRAARGLREGREAALQRALAHGDCVWDGDWLRVPHARWLHLDSIIARLF